MATAAELTKQIWLNITVTRKFSHNKVKGLLYSDLCLKWMTLSENTY